MTWIAAIRSFTKVASSLFSFTELSALESCLHGIMNLMLEPY